MVCHVSDILIPARLFCCKSTHSQHYISKSVSWICVLQLLHILHSGFGSDQPTESTKEKCVMEDNRCRTSPSQLAKRRHVATSTTPPLPRARGLYYPDSITSVVKCWSYL